jgi:hypothetical protein
MTRIHRRERRVRILDLVLGSFLRHMVRGPDSWHREFWVYLPHSDPVEAISSALLQEGYSLAPGKVQPFSTAFSPTDGLKPLEVLDDEDYFNIRASALAKNFGSRLPSSTCWTHSTGFPCQREVGLPATCTGSVSPGRCGTSLNRHRSWLSSTLSRRWYLNEHPERHAPHAGET